jgi:hypothetical protein
VPDPNKVALLIGIDTQYNKEPDWSPSLEPLHSCKKMPLISNFLSSKDYTIYGKLASYWIQT